MSGDQFTHAQFEWLRQVADDSEILPSGFKLAFIICQHLNRMSRTAWPSQPTLAKAIGASERTVRSLVEKLVERGHLEVYVSRGRHRSNVYTLVLHKPKCMSDYGDENRNSASSYEEQKEEARFRLSDEKIENLVHGNRKSTVEKTGSPPPKNSLREHSEENRRASAPSPDHRNRRGKYTRPTYTPAFEAFWSRYPRTKTANPKTVAFAAFNRLSPEDQALVERSLPAFAEFCRSQWVGYQPPGAAVFLRQRRFDDFAVATPAPMDTEKNRAGLLIKAEAYFDGEWRPGWGPAPGEPGCTIPEDIITAARRRLSKSVGQIRSAA
jgi:DNA-binding Lrp family transcriptional regulator